MLMVRPYAYRSHSEPKLHHFIAACLSKIGTSWFGLRGLLNLGGIFQNTVMQVSCPNYCEVTLY